MINDRKFAFTVEQKEMLHFSAKEMGIRLLKNFLNLEGELMKGLSKRIISVLMTTIMIFSMVAPAFASVVNNAENAGIDGDKGQFVITNPDGTTEVVDESWEEKFPYGIFALSDGEMYLEEGGDEKVLTVHRLGGSVGKASAIVYYLPAVVENENGESSYVSAISADDIIIEVEDPLPITEYQAWGMPAAPESGDALILSKEGTDGNGNPCTLLYVEVEADAYEWYVLFDEDWTEIDYAETAELPVSAEDIEEYDFRLVYEVNGTRYSTDSYKGVEYVKPEEEQLPSMPADLELNPEKTFSALDLDDSDDEYSGWLFEVCFADGEYQKDIRLTVIDDSVAELMEFGTFTILDSVGADVHESINSVIMSIGDNDEDLSENAKVGFAINEATFDKSNGVATVTVERTGSIINTLSVDWSLESGSAVVGKDYADASGTLYFYGEQTTATIEIELVNDKVLCEDEKDFTVKLSNLLGDDNAELVNDTFTVWVYNSDSSSEMNLSSVLYDVETDDVSGNIEEVSTTKVVTETIGGTQTVGKGLDPLSDSGRYATIDFGTESEDTLDPLYYSYGKVSFNSGDWGSSVNHSVSVSGKGNHSQSKQIPNLGSMYDSLISNTTGIAELATAWKLTWRGLEYTYSYFQYKLGSDTVRKEVYHKGWREGLTYYLSYSSNIYFSDSWDYTEKDGSITAGLARYDAHDCANTITAKANVTLYRRKFNNNFYLDIYTANDEYNEKGVLTNSNVSKLPVEYYKSIQPEIAFVSNAGGASYGQMYVGSSFTVDLSKSHLDCVAAYIVDSTGKRFAEGTVNGNMVTFSNIIANPTGDCYITIVLDRKQNVNLSIVTSSEIDANGVLVDNAYKNASELFKSRVTDGKITVGYSVRKTSGDYKFKDEIEETKIDISDASMKSDGILSLVRANNIANVQYINFNLPEEDMIVFAGKSYSGNQNIKLEQSHLSMNDILFYYYHEDFLTAQRPMQLTIDTTAIYYDRNGNGQIDGYYNTESGVFILTEVNGVTDELVSYVDNGDFEETQFEPYVDESGKVYQYFLRPYYVANPVSLVVPTGHSVDERMQVMPNFITDVTDSSVYEALTKEQKQYRAIVSGMTKLGQDGTLHYSADDHYKYTAAASAYSYVDIPLGGDTNPSHHVKSVEILASAPQNGRFTANGIDYMSHEGLAYYYSATGAQNLGDAIFVWEPEYFGNLLTDFDSPAPVNIPHSLAGDNIPITNELELWYLKEDGTWTNVEPVGEGEGYAKDDLGLYTSEIRANDEGTRALNEYLGSFTGNDTFALVVQEQKRTTDEIMNTFSVLDDDENAKAETVTRGTLGLYPNSEYLKQNGSTASAGDAGNDGESEYPEFSVDAEPELFSFSGSVLGAFEIETDGYEISLGFGIPVYSKDNGGDTGSAVNTFDDVKEAGEKIGNFIKNVFTKGGQPFKNLAADDFGKKGTKLKSVEFSMSVALGINLKYNPLDNSYKFSEAAIAFSAGIELRLSYRFSVLPLLYVYVQFSFEVSAETGLGREREAVEGDIILNNSEGIVLRENPTDGESNRYAFITDKKAFNIQFEGKLYMEFFEVDDKDGDGVFDEGTDTIGKRAEGFNSGYISSDGKNSTEVMIKLQKGFDLGKDILIILTAIDDSDEENGKATLNRIALIKDVENDIYWKGISIGLEGGVEVGVGAGIDIAKVEIFVKANINFAFTLGVYNAEEDKYEPATIDEFGLSAGLGVRAVFLFFSFELDLIGYSLNYSSDDGWTHGWSAVGGKYGDTSELSDGGEKINVYIQTPSQVRASVYGNNVNGTEGDMTEQAYNSNTPDFQVSGYGASVNAFKLVGDVETGYEYQIVTVGDTNYVVYTGTNTDVEQPVDNTEIWLSKLEVNDDVYGFVNPIAGNGTAEQKYIAVDGDGTGDLDFYAFADDDGKSINVIWISYGEKTETPVMPSGEAYGGMNETNYDSIVKPDLMDVPDVSDYYISVEDYNELTSEEQEDYLPEFAEVPVEEPEDEPEDEPEGEPEEGELEEGELEDEPELQVIGYYHVDYTDYQSACDAYDEANDLYADSKAEYDSYTAWYKYFRGTDAERQIVDASQNTVVKFATFDTSDVGSDGFSDVTVLSDSENETYYFMPVSAGDVSVFVQSVLYNTEELDQRFTEYKKFLDNIMVLDDNASDPSGYLEASKQFRLNYQKSFLEIYGGNSMLTVNIPGKTLTNNVMYVSLHQEDGNGVATEQTHEVITNIDLTEIDGTYYLAYVTLQDFFEKNGGAYTDCSGISRFYLRTFTVDDDGRVEWGTPYLLRSVVNFEEDSSKDGVYSNGSLVKRYNDAYISNISFLDGKIGDKLTGDEETFYPFADVEEETFLLFEMNGSTYVIKEDSLKSIVGDSHTGVISPFFTPEQVYGDRLPEDQTEGYSSNKSEVVIGADGEGNVAAIYTSSVPGTTNNAIYISYWDYENGAWSSGVMLAMNYMDVYERSIANSWDSVETEAAYLDSTLGGGMTSMTFSGLQVALGRVPAEQSMETMSADGETSTSSVNIDENGYVDALSKLGITIPENEDEYEVFSEEFSDEDLYVLSEELELLGIDTGRRNSSVPELLILTMGSLVELWEYEANGEKIIAAKNEEGKDTAEHADLGVYAISYGKGGQQVGNAAIYFGYNEFSVGSELYASVSFKNVGDAAIRGSVDQPITVNLMAHDADGAPQLLTSWQITQSIGAGQIVNLSTDSAYCAPLASSLGAGDYFYITVSEDEYASTPYVYDSSTDANCIYTFNIESKTELAIESFNADIIGVSDEGDSKIDFSFDVTNRGTVTAEDVYVQFSYVSGYDEDGSEIYSPLDITDSDIYVSQQKLITDDMFVLGVNDLANGIIYLGTDSKFYTDAYYITEDDYNAIIARYYSTTPVEGWDRGTYNGTTYYFDKLHYTSAYAAYTAGSEAVKNWSNGGNGYYYNNAYDSYADAKSAADAARKAEYVLTAAQYNALGETEKAAFKQASDNAGYYIPSGYATYSDAISAYESALEDNSQQIKGNYFRTVEGEIRVAPEKFKGNITGSLNIKAEVFSSTSNPDYRENLHVSKHTDEYDGINNSDDAQLEQSSFVNVAAKVVIARGSERTLPVDIRTTTGKSPVISVIEVADGSDELSTLYYTPDADSDGVASVETGSITIVGRTLGEGVIHIVDSATNTTYAIAYIVAEEGNGVNIYNDDAQFSFYNADGSRFNEEEPAQDWSFKDVSSWTNVPAVPYLSNLAIGKQGTTFTFNTKASEISFSLIGSAVVKSNKFPGEYIVSSDGSVAPPLSTSIDFGNDTHITHTITVTVTSETAYFDTVHLAYAGEYSPSDDISAPGLYFGRSFPTAHSVKTGETVEITVYAIDESGLQSMMFNNTVINAADITKTDDNLWSYTFSVNANENFIVSAVDTNGNTTNRSVEVDWFGDDETTPYGMAPELVVSLKKVVGDAVTNVTEDTTLIDTELVVGGHIYIDVSGDEASVVYSEYDKETARFAPRDGVIADKLTANGYYLVKATSIDSYNTWSQQIFAIDCVESTPEVRVNHTALSSPNGIEFSYVATKDEESTAKLTSVSVNDISLTDNLSIQSSSYSGSIVTKYGGVYTFKAIDSKNVTGMTMVDVAVPVDISSDAIFSYVDAWGQPENGNVYHGSVTVDFTKISGGDYANTAEVMSVDEYYGAYEFAVLPASDVADKLMPSELEDGTESWLTELTWIAADSDDIITVDGLEVLEDASSEYVVIIRDRQNPTEYSTMAIYKFTLVDNAIDITNTISLLSSSVSSTDGKIYVTASKGLTGKYEFAVLPMAVDTENSTEEVTLYIPLTEADFMKDDVVWKLADFDGEGDTVTFEGLGCGKYMVAVRSLNVDSEMGDTLTLNAAAIVNAKTEVNAVQTALANAISAMKTEIGAHHSEWGAATDVVNNAKTTYDELLGKLESGDATVTNDMVDDAYDAWQSAISAENTAKDAYVAALVGIDETKLAEIIALRDSWQNAEVDTKEEARATYDNAISEFCTAYQNAAYQQSIDDANTALAEAESAYSVIALEALSASGAEYDNDATLWDGMLISEEIFVPFAAPTNVKLSSTSSSSSKPTGTVKAVATGGTAYDGGEKVYYQFALLPIESEEAAVDYSENMAEIGNLGLDWQFADSVADIEQSKVFKSLDAGWYQVFVRVVYDPDITDDTDVNKLLYTEGVADTYAVIKATYDAAEAATEDKAVRSEVKNILGLYDDYKRTDDEALLDAYLTAIGNTSKIIELRDAWLNSTSATKKATRKAYEEAVLEYVNAKRAAELQEALTAYNEINKQLCDEVALAYAENPAKYETASFGIIRVSTSMGTFIEKEESSAIISKEETKEGVNYIINCDTDLTDADAKDIYKANGEDAVVLIIGDRKVVVAEGVLESDDEVSKLIDNFAGGEGNVVEFTAADGTCNILPIGIAENGKTAYAYVGDGKYAVVKRESTFDDIDGHWAESNIIFGANRNLFKGVDDGIFAPEATMTRAMLVTLIYRLEGEPEVSGEMPFTDVISGAWYYDALLWGYQNNIIMGVSETSFNPDGYITREQMVTIFFRYLSGEGYVGDERSNIAEYGDNDSVSDYANEAFAWSIASGIVVGTDEKLLVPDKIASRAEIAAITERAIRYILK